MFFDFLKKQKIHLYTICWNEEYMLKYFFKYYDPLVDRYVFFDDGSTDLTLSILQKHPKVEIRRFQRPDDNDSYVLAAQNVHNTCWKESRGAADWVIITAVDEFLYTRNLKSYLAKCTKEEITAIPALGFQMISATRPTANRNLPEIVKRGCPLPMMNKLSIFNPNEIVKTIYIPGRHAATLIGEVKYPEQDELLNLHYKHLSFEHTFQRNADLQKKLGSVDNARGFGQEYSWSKEKFMMEEWNVIEQNSVENIFSPNYNINKEHSPLAERWWRKDAANL